MTSELSCGPAAAAVVLKKQPGDHNVQRCRLTSKRWGVTGCWGGSPGCVKPDLTVLHASSLLHLLRLLRSRRVDLGGRIFGEVDAGVVKVVLLQLTGRVLQTEDSVPSRASLSGQNASHTGEFTCLLAAAFTSGCFRVFFLLNSG